MDRVRRGGGRVPDRDRAGRAGGHEGGKRAPGPGGGDQRTSIYMVVSMVGGGLEGEGLTLLWLG